MKQLVCDKCGAVVRQGQEFVQVALRFKEFVSDSDRTMRYGTWDVCPKCAQKIQELFKATIVEPTPPELVGRHEDVYGNAL